MMAAVIASNTYIRGDESLDVRSANRTFHWEGPALTCGKGYTVHIHVDPNGAVTEQHCLMPRCSLDGASM